jgi:Putative Ig domain
VRKLQFFVPLSWALALAASARADPLAIVTTSLPSGAYGVAYSLPLSAVGGTPPYQWCGPSPALCPWGTASLLQGEMPPGIALSADGTLSGTPQGSGSSSFQVEVQDATGQTQLSNFYTLNVIDTGPLVVATSSLPVGFLGQPYDSNLAAAGGKAPYSHDPNSGSPSNAGWLVVDTTRGPISGTDMGADLGGAAPLGLTLDIGGKLSGTPTQAGNYILAVQVTDSSVPPQVATGMITFTVTPGDGLRLLNTSPPEGTKGAPYSLQLATSATDPQSVEYLLIDSAGHNSPAARASLPPGITLSLGGLLSGVPSLAGAYAFLVQATDGQNRVATQALQLTIVDSGAGTGGGCSSLGGDTSGIYVGVLVALAAMSRSRKRR